jgi:hypothetical protein
MPASALVMLASVTVAEPLVTVAVSVLPALMLAPLNETVADPEVAVSVGAPAEGLQALAMFVPFGVSTTRPEGSVSVNPTPVSVPLPGGSVIAYESTLVSPSPIELGKKLLVIVGGLVVASALAGNSSAAATSDVKTKRVDFTSKPFPGFPVDSP